MIVCILLISLALISAPAVPATPGPAEAARAAFETGNYSLAVKTVTAALSDAPQDPSLHYWALRSYYELRDYENAINHGEKAVKLDPHNGEYNRWLGRAYGAKAELSHSFFIARKVKQAFEAAVHFAPASIPARRDLMQFLAEAPWIVGGDKQKAKEQAVVISKMDPVEGHLAQGAYFAADKKWKEAEAEYAAALDSHPRSVDSYIEVAEFFEERKDGKQVERAVEGAKRIDSNDPRLDYYRAVSLILRGEQLQTAEKLLQSYVANVPQRSDYPSHRSAQEWLNRIGHQGED
jgi:tetratricopeptide (TPR) repeat protein